MGTKPKSSARKNVPNHRGKKPSTREEMENITLDMEHDRMGINEQFIIHEEHEMDLYFRQMQRPGKRVTRDDDEDNFSYWYGQT